MCISSNPAGINLACDSFLDYSFDYERTTLHQFHIETS
jgi:hypothetical protein